ncbi:hypothetical protein HUX88_29170 [Duganella sp. BJB1802]|uniref:hypothetical protein n=1 Tax=unclassified Duganella TaxID=2636909 RepID=UPI0011C1A666|nr:MULTISPECIES: hypothetical protein [unclassified Duganella]NVD74560.1 hypothetical protein [Duganella sp. BJB1802]
MAVSKMTVATEYLNRAIELYFRGDSDFSALHLAGAAQELLGKFVGRAGRQSAHSQLVDGALRIANVLPPTGKPATEKGIKGVISFAKNRVKHMDETGDDMIEYDVRKAAADMLDIAIAEFYELFDSGAEISISPEIERYNHHKAASA